MSMTLGRRALSGLRNLRDLISRLVWLILSHCYKHILSSYYIFVQIKILLLCLNIFLKIQFKEHKNRSVSYFILWSYFMLPNAKIQHFLSLNRKTNLSSQEGLASSALNSIPHRTVLISDTQSKATDLEKHKLMANCMMARLRAYTSLAVPSPFFILS